MAAEGAALAAEEGVDDALTRDKYIGLALALSSSAFIGASFIVKKKGLRRAAAAVRVAAFVRLASSLSVSLSLSLSLLLLLKTPQCNRRHWGVAMAAMRCSCRRR